MRAVMIEDHGAVENLVVVIGPSPSTRWLKPRNAALVANGILVLGE